MASKYWSFSFSISEYSGLISFRMDGLDLLAVQGTLKSLLQYYSLKASILWCSGFFIVHLSHQYMTTGKTIALTRRTFVGKVMSLLFNMYLCISYSIFHNLKRQEFPFLFYKEILHKVQDLRACHRFSMSLQEVNKRMNNLSTSHAWKTNSLLYIANVEIASPVAQW